MEFNPNFIQDQVTNVNCFCNICPTQLLDFRNPSAYPSFDFNLLKLF